MLRDFLDSLTSHTVGVSIGIAETYTSPCKLPQFHIPSAIKAPPLNCWAPDVRSLAFLPQTRDLIRGFSISETWIWALFFSTFHNFVALGL